MTRLWHVRTWPGKRSRRTLTGMIEVRNYRFALDASVPRHWHGGRKSVTTFFDALSTFFPAGERFFIASVRAYRSRVTDERLLEDVRAFSGQEGVHGREHDRYNELLRERGYPVDELERGVEALLGRVTRAIPRRSRLAATCALEHFTAVMGHLLLGDARCLEGADPTMAALWRWHAVEENEHKSVAFDVYRAAGGTYSERVVVMAAASVVFWAKVLEHQARMMSADGTALSPREWLALGRFLFVDPGVMRRMLGLYLRYYRPGFHPSEIDSTALLAAWRQANVAAPASRAA
jgi:predicted metal-dependent hydrolase